MKIMKGVVRRINRLLGGLWSLDLATDHDKITRQITYIRYLVKDDVDLWNKIEFRESGVGYGVSAYKVEGTPHYEMHLVPKRLSIFVKLTLAHELGHIIFDEMVVDNAGKLEKRLLDIRKYDTFRILQKFYYWNRILRKIKIFLGFSRKLDHARDDIYNYSGFTREENELHSDWFAINTILGLMQDVI